MELEIGGQKYSIGKMNAMQQFHVARRLAPVLWAFGGAAGTAVKKLQQSGADMGGDIELLQSLGPVADVIAGMSDADSEYVLANCLSACQKQVGGGWQSIYVMGGGFMFNDIGLDVMLQLTAAVIKDNMGNFFSALPGM